ncbi:NADH dehydrogenase subunit E [Roseovarius litorisediminis]|uniref:NADH dehydrogenase subunit E n=1 Tax=Roseovarius litorisediminis TaxID=1312363 RepID=A0A1Y5S757_9RHOB|nr:hypothetical protein [Roseovarius litorisediminis]SLN34006.1 NADH dehydrogenase subunit E [Roseovarius litorisediminis]
MSNSGTSGSCPVICWGLALIAGLITVWSTIDAVGFVAALMLGLALAVLLGLVLTQLFCSASESHVVPSDASAPVEKRETAKPAVNKAVAPETASAAKETASAPADEVEAEKTQDSDGDGVLEGEDEGAQPETLKAARGGKADDLKQIRGVGPKLEVLLNEMGFYHFDQIAGWNANEVAWVNANLKGFKGRVTRDNWVEQARILAAGGETEFSKRVEDGGVY